MVRLFREPLSDLGECAYGHHRWQKTLLIGQSVCAHCGMIGYCLYCAPGDIPPGSPLRSCRFHRYSPAPLADSLRPLSAFSKGDAL
ncbi:MAG TPA: hypothetical protein VFV38_11975 [Ktedonobacteraceae bacterium]|nr:hypothetical protein [Ktedonobacteraceae bacterium]